MTTIIDVIARQILDSRGNPTVEVEVELESGAVGRAAVPSGASTGEDEAVELRDEGGEYFGKGVRKAVDNVNSVIAEEIMGLDATDQRLVDRTLIELDGTPNKAKLGANAILGVSLAAAYAAAAARRAAPLPVHRRVQRLPAPGAHDEHPERRQARRQQRGPAGVHDHARGRRQLRGGAAHLRRGLSTACKSVLKNKGLSTAVGDEGGFAPDLDSNEEAIEVILEAIDAAGYKPGDDVRIALDPAASSFFLDGTLRLGGGRPQPQLRRDGRLLRRAGRQVPHHLHRGRPGRGRLGRLQADDRESLGDRVQIVGDDLFVTNTERLARGIDERVGQLRPHQAQPDRHAHRDARRHRDGQARRLDGGRARIAPARPRTRLIADLAVATNAGQIKTGAPARSDRVAKYNQLLRIEEMLGDAAYYPGMAAFYNLRS